MGVPFLLIDGYNLLHAAGLARVRYAAGDLERARQRLLGMISEKLSPVEQMRCTVVFDAGENAPHTSRESRHHEIRVLFAPPGFEADDVIEQLIAQHPAAKQLVVVSGDHRLHKAAHRRHAQPVDSDPFWERLRSRPDARTSLVPDSPPPGSKPSGTNTSAATAAWLREFGEISVAELEAEVQAEDHSPRDDTWQKHLADLERTLEDPRQMEQWLQDTRRNSRDGRLH